MPRRPAVLVVLVAAAACSGSRGKNDATPAPADLVARPAAWDALCPAKGATPPLVVRIAQKDLRFEPSAAAAWDGKLAVFSDKEAVVWWWVPGQLDVTHDPAWDFKVDGAPGPDECCTTTPGPWGSELKRKLALETCGAHGVAAGSRIPWLKAEGAASSPAGIHVMGNMGFGCRDNNGVLRLPAPGAAPVEVPGINRDLAMQALGTSDIRMEGMALFDGGKGALMAVRQRDEATLTRTVIVVEGLGSVDARRRVTELLPPAGSRLRLTPMGLSDIAVLPDGRVGVTVSQEDEVDGHKTVSGELWVTQKPRPWTSADGWETTLVTVFPDHKPEVLVMLSARCAVVMFDDDEGYKAQQRRRAPDPMWDPAAAFISYVRMP